MAAEESTSGDWRPWPIAGVIFLLELILFCIRLVRFPGPSRYFAFQWTISYAHGLSRRGLLGTLLRMAHLDNGNFALITVIGWAITLCVAYIVVAAVIKVFEPFGSNTQRVLMVALLLSPITLGTLVCTTSDPLQIPLFGLLLLITIRGRTPIVLSFLLFAALGALSILIHEATIFFLGPILLVDAFLIRPSTSARAALAGYVVGAVPVLAWILFSTQNHAATVLAPLHYRHLSMVADPPNTMETFSQLLAEENAAHFHSGLKGYVLLVRNAAGALWLPAFYTFILARVFSTGNNRRSARRWWQGAVVLLVLNLPLWPIAHDWGRFASYLFISLLILLSVSYRSTPESMTSDSIRQLPAKVLGTLLVLSGVANSPEFSHFYNIKGLGSDNNVFLASIIVSLSALYFLSRETPFREPLSAGEPPVYASSLQP